MELTPSERFLKIHKAIVTVIEGWNLPAPHYHDPQTDALQKIAEALRWADEEIHRLKKQMNGKKEST